MTVLLKFKNGTSTIEEITKVKCIQKNPCVRCRSGGGCYDHGCFMPEEWGEFLDLGKNKELIKVQDIEFFRVISI